MYLYSDPSDDILHPKNEPGAYEWWYFDALDPVTGYGIVIILYDGLLFSPDYHDAVKMRQFETANYHPGFSLSMYDGDRTIFYSLASYAPDQTHFGALHEPVSIGNNKVVVTSVGGKLVYEIHIDETLPSGLRANGMIRFESDATTTHSSNGNPQSHHRWNLVQPNASVTGAVEVKMTGKTLHTCTYDTKGYHDHNIGMRPLEHDFDEWYWGRIHIGDATLVWYNMNTSGSTQTACWLFEKDGVDFGQKIHMESTGQMSTSLFGLKRVYSWAVTIKGETFRIIDDHMWDNGPFYQRYSVRLVDAHNKMVQGAFPGIAEYIKPNRIVSNWVRPMIKIRHHKAGNKGNWIQQSLLLSRRTW
jgi:carotenoid 1,2-hydratase